jgi:Ca-activated chloride channel family protein
LVIITDGETHDENAIEQATLAKEEGILIYTLGIGTPEGAPVPEYTSGNRVEYKKRDGRYVISQLNTKLLQEIAETGGGAFYHFTGSSDALNRLYDRISHMGEIEDEESNRITELMNDIYQIPLTAAIVAMIAGLSIGQRRRSNQI